MKSEGSGAALAASNFMNDTTIQLDKTEDEMFVHAISDEALEIAAGSGEKGGNYTLYFCTALALCPGP